MISLHPGFDLDKKVTLLARANSGNLGWITSRHREASRSTPEPNALGNQERTRAWAAPSRRGAYAHACWGALHCQTVTLKQGARGKERNTTGITSCVQFRVTLARFMGRPTCLRSGPLGLALCGGPSWVQAGPPIVRQCQHRSLVVTR